MNDLQYLPRLLGPTIERALESFPVVVLTGARQTGKTTLARNLASADSRMFRTLDDLRVLEQAERDPDLLVREAERLTLDEVQREPDLLRAVKRAVDEDRRPGRFLLTGSANLLLLRTVSETLAGRAVYLRLGPMTVGEKTNSATAPSWDGLLSVESAEQAERFLRARPARPLSWQDAALQGGYPPVLHLAPEDRARWFDGYLATYLERDLQQVAGISALADFRRLIQIAALRLGGILNQADLARDAGLSRPTAHRYLGLLEVSHQIRKLPAFIPSRTARLVKAPKLFWTDTGFAAQLAGISDLGGEPRSGNYLENLILGDMDAWRETVAPRPEVFYWRTAGGIEVDFVLEQRRALLPVEVKTASNARAGDAVAIERFLTQYRRARWGMVVHTGEDVYRLSARVVAAPLGRLVG